jgi:DNA uptake protein ComE-like DNA-binding protein
MSVSPLDTDGMSVFAGVLAHRAGRLIAMTTLVAAAVGVGVLMTSHGTDQPMAPAIPAVAAPGPGPTLLVFVSGAVARPGLYEVATGARIADAIADAGGILPAADPGRLPNLSALLHDGHQVNVPFAKGSSAPATARIDVNSASVAELETVPGVTPDLAQAIVDTRMQWGAFASLSDLRTALGLDAATATLIGKHLSFLTELP